MGGNGGPKGGTGNGAVNGASNGAGSASTGAGGPNATAIGGFQALNGPSTGGSGGTGGGDAGKPGDTDAVGGFQMRLPSSGGAPLAGGMRNKLESSFEKDLGHVRVHSGPESVKALDATNADAMAAGNDIHTRPGLTNDTNTMAHEAAHVLQQGGGGGVGGVSSPSDAHEREAHHAAGKAAKGKKAGAVKAGKGNKVSRKEKAGGGGGGVKATFSGFINLKPSQRAREWTGVGNQMNAGLDVDVKAANDARPVLHAKLGAGAGEGAPDGKVQKAKGGKAKAGDPKGPVIPAGGGVVVPVPTPTVVPIRQRALPSVSVAKDVTPEAGLATVQRTFAGISTDLGVSTTAGPRPKVPTTGEANPQKTEEARAATKDEAQAATTKAKQDVDSGRGPEVVQPTVLDETGSIRDAMAEQVSDTKAIPGMEEFVALGLPKDVEGTMDEQQQALMDASLAEARGQVDLASDKKDVDQKALMAKAEGDARRANEQAQAEQDAAVAKGRGDITKARDDTKAQQDKAMADFDADMASKQKSEVDAMNAHVAKKEAEIDKNFKEAEKTVDGQVAESQRKAEAKKKEEEEKARNPSIWDRVKNAVSAVFEALTSFINDLLEGLQKLVKATFDAVKSLANTIIDGVCTFITSAIKKFATILKAAITTFIGSVFPELAEKLNGMIDAATDWVCKQVEKIAAKVKAAIAAVCDYCSSALAAVLAVLQTAVNLALVLAEAALTGDWAGVARKVLEAVLKLAGIPQAEFDAMVKKNEDTINTIVADPGQFLGNMIGGVRQGFGQFGDNFLTHLQGGFLTWLTKTTAEAGVATLGSFDLKDIFGFAADTLGINKQYIHKKAANLVGEKNADRLDWVMDTVGTALEGGWDGLWEYMQGYADGFYDLVIGKIQDFILKKVVQAAVIKIASMFNPVGAIVQAVITVWNLYTFVRDQMQRIMGVVKAITSSLSDLANGNISGAANLIEGALAMLVPVAIDLLAKLIGLGGIGKKVQEVITGIREKIDAAIDKMIMKIMGMFKGGDSKGKDGENKSKGDGTGDQPGKPTDTKGHEKDSADYGPAETFSDGQETHHIYVESGDGKGAATLMMASTPRPMSEQLDRIKAERMKTIEVNKQARGEKDRDTSGKLIGECYSLTKKLGVDIKGVSTKKAVKGQDGKDAKADDPNAATLNGIRDNKAKLAANMQSLYQQFLGKGADQDLEKDRSTFEMEKIGPRAYGDNAARSTIVDMCKKAWAWLNAKAQTEFGDDQAKIQAELEKLAVMCGGKLSAPGRFIGQVGTKYADIEKVFLNGGNMEEMTTHLTGFQRMFGDDILTTPNKKLENILALVKQEGVKVEEVKKRREELLGGKGIPMQDVKDTEGKVVDQKPDADQVAKAGLKANSVLAIAGKNNEEMKPENKGGMDYKRPSTPLTQLAPERLKALAKTLGITDVDDKGPDQLVAELGALTDNKGQPKLPRKGAEIMSPAGEQHPDSWSMRKRNPMNQKNSTATNEEKDAASQVNPYVMSSRQEKGVNPVGDDLLPTVEGDLANILYEFDPFIEITREMSMPLRAGASGTTERFVQMAEWFGLNVANTRLAMLGHLIPIRAHSFHEVMTAASGHGSLTYERGNYKKIEPLPDAWEQPERERISGDGTHGTVGAAPAGK